MAFNSTTGLGTPTKLVVDSSNVTLSLSGTGFPATHQINTQIQDAGGNEQATGTALTLTAAANAAAGVTAYTGTITGGAANALVGNTYVVAGFDLAANNGTFICTASSATVLTLDNAAGVADTHAATATSQEATDLTYVAYGFSNVVAGAPSAVATVSASGLITAHATGGTVVEVSYPAFNNSVGDIASTGNIMNGLPLVKIYTEINVTVVP